MHVAVDTLGHLLTLLVTLANEQDRTQVGELAQGMQDAIGCSVEIAFVDQAYTGDSSAQAAADQGLPSSSLRQNGALCCCRGDGWLVFDAFHATTSGFPPQ